MRKLLVVLLAFVLVACLAITARAYDEEELEDEALVLEAADLEHDVLFGWSDLVNAGKKAAETVKTAVTTVIDTAKCLANSGDAKKAEDDRSGIYSGIPLTVIDAQAAFFASAIYNPNDNKKLAGFTTVQIIQIQTAKAGLFVNTATKVLIVAVQGTSNDWTSVNFKLVLVQNPFAEGRVHQGFLTEVQQLMGNANFVNNIGSYVSKGFTVVTTGHSQGAAESGILAQAIAQKFPAVVKNLRVVALAPPRAGDNTYASKFAIKATRYVSGGDPVPTVPPREVCFQHVGELRTLPCPYSGASSVFCHYPDYYFDGINNQLPSNTKLAVVGRTIVDEFNVPDSQRTSIASNFQRYANSYLSAKAVVA